MEIYAWAEKKSPFKFGAKRNGKLLLLGVMPWEWAALIYGETVVEAVKKSSYEHPCKLTGEITIERTKP